MQTDFHLVTWFTLKSDIVWVGNMDVSKNSGKTPKMDGEHNGKPYEQMDDLGGVFPPFKDFHPYPMTPKVAPA